MTLEETIKKSKKLRDRMTKHQESLKNVNTNSLVPDPGEWWISHVIQYLEEYSETLDDIIYDINLN